LDQKRGAGQDLREMEATFSKIKLHGTRLSEEHMKLIYHAA